MRFATKITTHLLWDVTRILTCVVISVEKSYFWEILAAMRASRGPLASHLSEFR